MKDLKREYNRIVNKKAIPSGVADLIKVYERFQKAYIITDQYLECISPKAHQANSSNSFIGEVK